MNISKEMAVYPFFLPVLFRGSLENDCNVLPGKFRYNEFA